jgi:chromosome segregation ATPase
VEQLADAETRAGAAEAGLEGIRQELDAASAREAHLADELRQKSDALKDFDELVTKIATAEIEINRLSEAEQLMGEKLAQSEALLGEKSAQLDVAAARIEEFAAERSELVHRLADIDSTLRQREEEIAQAWSELEAVRLAKTEMQSEFDQLVKDAERQSRQLEEERSWTLTLARDRQIAEQQAGRLASVLARERASFEKRLNEAHNQADTRISLQRAQIAELVELLASRETQIAQSEQRIDAHIAEVADLTNLLGSRESEVADKGKIVDELQSEISMVRQENASANITLADIRRQLAITDQQLASRTAAVNDHEAVAQKNAQRMEWLRSVNQIVLGSARRWHLIMPPGWRHRRVLRALQHKGLFNASAYLERYPDVAEARMDALRHFILHGMLEGRSTGFD